MAPTKRFQSNWLTLILVFALIVASLAVLTYNMNRSDALVRRVLTEDARMLKLHIDIMRLDELLTHYARASVSVADTVYAKPFANRYNELVDELDAALGDAIALAPPEVAEEIDRKTKDANDRLVAMEVRSFELVAAGKLDEARQFMYSEEYNKQKKIYAEGMIPLLNFLNQATVRVDEEREAAETQNLLATLAVILSFLGILYLLFSQLRSSRQLGKAYQDMQGLNSNLTQSQSELQASNDSLLSMQSELQANNEQLSSSEVELKAANDYLMSMQNELTVSLEQLKSAQNSLVQSEKMASLGQLVAGVAHEINTPIGVAVTASSHLDASTREFVEILNSGRINKNDLVKYARSADESTTLIQNNLQRAAELIKSFKKVSVNQSSEERMAFIVSEFLKEVVTTLGPTFKTTKIDIQIHVSEPLRIVSYPSAISQIVINLVMNAHRHAFDDGKLPGTIHLEARALNEGMIELVVRDSGKGIPEENLPRIFDPFYTTRRGDGGSGLGLNIVFNIATQQLGGRIVCESTVGVGTNFILQFPAEVIESAVVQE